MYISNKRRMYISNKQRMFPVNLGKDVENIILDFKYNLEVADKLKNVHTELKNELTYVENYCKIHQSTTCSHSTAYVRNTVLANCSLKIFKGKTTFIQLSKVYGIYSDVHHPLFVEWYGYSSFSHLVNSQYKESNPHSYSSIKKLHEGINEILPAKKESVFQGGRIMISHMRMFGTGFTQYI